MVSSMAFSSAYSCRILGEKKVIIKTTRKAVMLLKLWEIFEPESDRQQKKKGLKSPMNQINANSNGSHT